MKYTPLEAEPFEEVSESKVVVRTSIEFWTPEKEFFISILKNTSAWMKDESEAYCVSFRTTDISHPLVTQTMSKMEAIKTLRGLASVGLKEAKEAIDRII